MKNKIGRLQNIKDIITTSRISSQEELLGILISRGFDLTQATLSRDLKQLQIAKVPGSDGGYIYILPETSGIGKLVSSKVFANYPGSATGYISLEFSGHLAVMKTRPGYASSIAYDIDNSATHEIIGTIAGDDTILLVLREGVSREEVIESLASFIPSVKENIHKSQII